MSRLLRASSRSPGRRRRGTLAARPRGIVVAIVALAVLAASVGGEIEVARGLDGSPVSVPPGVPPGGFLRDLLPSAEEGPHPSRGGPAVPSDGVAGQARYAIGSTADFSDLPRTGERHRLVVMQAWEHDRIGELKRRNPGVRVLVYKNLSFAIDGRGPEGLSSTGVNLDEARDEWFLRDAGGNRFTSSGYDFLWGMDVGNAEYRRRWADNVAAELEAKGWDGVFLDDVNPSMKYHHGDHETIRGYPSDRAYTDATLGALAEITPRIRQAGGLAIANNALWVEYPEDGSAFLDHLDGAMDEMFTRFTTTGAEGDVVCEYRDATQWEVQLREIQEAERRGKAFVGVAQTCAADSPADREAAARFGFASTLLGSEGRALFFAGLADYNAETWYPGYRLTTAIGRPIGPAERLEEGLWRRRFEKGLVVVNPGDEMQAVSFGGPYAGWGLAQPADRAEVPGHGALVLERAAEP